MINQFTSIVRIIGNFDGKIAVSIKRFLLNNLFLSIFLSAYP
jgi:hypothetical protein